MAERPQTAPPPPPLEKGINGPLLIQLVTLSKPLATSIFTETPVYYMSHSRSVKKKYGCSPVANYNTITNLHEVIMINKMMTKQKLQSSSKIL